MPSDELHRRELLRLLAAVAPGAGVGALVAGCRRRRAPADLADWLAEALYGSAPAEEVAGLRRLLRARAGASDGAALAAVLRSPMPAAETWPPPVWRAIGDVLRRHLAASPHFRRWAGLTTDRGPACSGLAPWPGRPR